MSYANIENLKLSSAQKYFLQIMLQKSVIDQVNFKTIFCKVLDRFEIEYTEDRLREIYVKFLKDINEIIRHFNLEIKTGTCEITGLSYFCLIQQTDTETAKLSGLYNPVELRIFRKVIELIIESDSGCIDFNYAVGDINDYYEELSTQANQQDGGITKVPSLKEIRIAIEKFLEDYWLMEIVNQPNKITLHGRALLELGQYIKQIVDNESLHNCHLCKNLVLNYFACENCSVRMHRYCAKKFYKDAQKCPSCHQTVSGELLNDMLESMKSAKDTIYTQLNNQ